MVKNKQFLEKHLKHMAFAVCAHPFVMAYYKELSLTISVITKYKLDNAGLSISQQIRDM